MVFLFQTGSIKSGMRMKSINAAGKSFYSKLVRLKVQTFIGALTLTLTFLFQTGSIKSQQNRTQTTPLNLCFYSKLVRLKAAFKSVRMQLLGFVSIPNWFD